MARAIGLVILLLAPAGLTYVTGHAEAARFVALGTLFAFNFGMLARPIAPAGLLIPGVYAAAAITAPSIEGVGALIVATAAATGAASSLGLHRGLMAVLAAALIGSFEPASVPVALVRAVCMLAGGVYGWVLVVTAGRGVQVLTRAVAPRTALTYSILLAVLVLTAWLVAHGVGLAEAWWLPLAVATLGEPWLAGSPTRAVAQLALALGGTLVLLAMLGTIMEPASRAICAVAFLLTLLAVGRQREHVLGFLVTPLLVVIASSQSVLPTHDYLRTTIFAFVVVSTFTMLGKWGLWTLRPDAGHVAA